MNTRNILTKVSLAIALPALLATGAIWEVRPVRAATKLLKLAVLAFFVAAFASTLAPVTAVRSQQVTDAPTGFDNLTNGFVDQAQFDLDRDAFTRQLQISDGLGPVYNGQSCAECHQNPVSGGISQTTALRAGHLDANGNFVDAAGGSLINDRATNANIQERVPSTAENIRTFRTSLNMLGDGFVEAIGSNTLMAISNGQPASMRGMFLQVPVGEANGTQRGGRFGWKNQHASLLSFAADEYLNEIGITSPLQPNENSSNGRSVAGYDAVPDPEDAATEAAPFGAAVEALARFMRATKAPPRDVALAATSDAQTGSNLFTQIGCSICHVRNITTAPTGTVINGGTFTVPDALGNKVIHPFSDFLLHDVGTGDGIVQNNSFQLTRNKLRTPPLWGVRTRDRLMHDGASLTRNEAILRHANEATSVINNYRALSVTQRNQIAIFLNSL
jgi:CxxC motif-containing protein (DUF1111 family)